MAYKRKRKKKKLQKPRKYSVSISRNQYELLKQHCAYTQNTPPQVLKHAISLYLRQVSHDLKQWKKITPGKQFLCEEDKARQMEMKF
jgi:hypothetical protein